MKLTDEMLRKMAHEVDAAILASLPDPKDCNHEFLPEFERKMEQLFLAFKGAAAEFAELVLEEYDPTVPAKLTPSPGGRECLGNGSFPGYECQCPDYDWFATICFPDDSH